MELAKDAVIGGINNLLSWLTSIYDTLILFKDSVLEWCADLIRKLSGFFDNLVDIVLSLPDKFKDLLIYLFVPSENPFLEIQKMLSDRFPIIEQLQKLLATFVFTGSGTLPQFNVTYFGVTVSIVDFEIFAPYIPVMHGIIIALAWYKFLHRLYNRLPSVIGGFYT